MAKRVKGIAMKKPVEALIIGDELAQQHDLLRAAAREMQGQREIVRKALCRMHHIETRATNDPRDLPTVLGNWEALVGLFNVRMRNKPAHQRSKLETEHFQALVAEIQRSGIASVLKPQPEPVESPEERINEATPPFEVTEEIGTETESESHPPQIHEPVAHVSF